MYYIQTGQGVDRLCIVTDVGDNGYWITTVQPLEKLTVKYTSMYANPEPIFYDALLPYMNSGLSNKFNLPGGYSSGLSRNNGTGFHYYENITAAFSGVGNTYDNGEIESNDFWLPLKRSENRQTGQNSTSTFLYLGHGKCTSGQISNRTAAQMYNGVTGEFYSHTYDLVATFNLLDTVKIKGGTGSKTDPYILGL